MLLLDKQQLEALKNKYINRLAVHFLLSREQTDAAIYSGRINDEKLNLLSEKLIDVRGMDDIFICGPAGMIETVKEFLLEKRFDKKKIHFELFGAGKIVTKSNDHTVKDLSTTAIVEIKLDGRTSTFNLPSNGISILEGALQLGKDLPYACKGGVCTTCRAKLLEGEVAMDANYGLDETEVKNGFILTCQSHPVTPKVVVDFDQK